MGVLGLLTVLAAGGVLGTVDTVFAGMPARGSSPPWSRAPVVFEPLLPQPRASSSTIEQMMCKRGIRVTAGRSALLRENPSLNVLRSYECDRRTDLADRRA